MRQCRISGCEKTAAYQRSLCGMHIQRWRRFKSFDLPVREKKTCTVEGCDRKSRSKGWCNMHRLRVKCHGTPGEASPIKGNGGLGSIDRKGYRYLYRPLHPNASKNGLVAEHVLVMSKILGRPLRKGETVHHKNGRRAENRRNNLQLWTKHQPSGQSVIDMIEFCRWYLKEYEQYIDRLTA